MREVLPWPILVESILSGPEASAANYARAQANAAFDRLAEKRSTYRKYLPFKV